MNTLTHPSPDTALIFWNAFEMALGVFMLIILGTILVRDHISFSDLCKKTKKMLRLDFQGGPHDLLIALFVLYVGIFLRAESVWEWRALGWELPIGRLSVGVMIKVIATFCLIRLLMPAKHYNHIAGLLFLASITFAAVAVIYK